MQKPEVRVIQFQDETTSKDVDMNSYEAQQLLMKYKANKGKAIVPVDPPTPEPKNQLTFDEMIALQDRKTKNEKQRALNKKQEDLNRPRMTDGRKAQYYDNIYSSVEGTDIGFNIQISSDMKF